MTSPILQHADSLRPDEPIWVALSDYDGVKFYAWSEVTETPTSVRATSGSYAAGTVTMICVNELKIGDVVTLAGFVPTDYNGTYEVTSADATQFTYAIGTAPGVVTTVGTISYSLFQETPGGKFGSLTVNPCYAVNGSLLQIGQVYQAWWSYQDNAMDAVWAIEDGYNEGPPEESSTPWVIELASGTVVSTETDGTIFDATVEVWPTSSFVDGVPIWALDLNSGDPLTTGTRYITNRVLDEYGQPVSKAYGPYYMAIDTGADHPLTDTAWWIELVNGTSPSAWDIGTAYVVGDLVTESGNTYICIAGNTGNIPPDTDYWVPVTIDNLGAYDADTTYTPGDYVQEPRPLFAFKSGVGAITTDAGVATGPDYEIHFGTSGTDLNTAASGSTVTLNVPDASITARGVITTGNQSLSGEKTFINDVYVGVFSLHPADVIVGDGTVSGYTTTPLSNHDGEFSLQGGVLELQTYAGIGPETSNGFLILGKFTTDSSYNLTSFIASEGAFTFGDVGVYSVSFTYAGYYSTQVYYEAAGFVSSTTTAGFTVPSLGSGVTVSMDTTGMSNGDWIKIDAGGLKWLYGFIGSVVVGSCSFQPVAIAYGGPSPGDVLGSGLTVLPWSTKSQTFFHLAIDYTTGGGRATIGESNGNAIFYADGVICSSRGFACLGPAEGGRTYGISSDGTASAGLTFYNGLYTGGTFVGVLSITGDDGTATGLTITVGGTATAPTLTLGAVLKVENGGTGIDSSAFSSGSVLEADGAGSFVEKKNNYSGGGAPTVNDDSGDGYSIGSLWIG